MKKIGFLFLLVPCWAWAQVKGTVVSETTRQPVPFASVFINNSTIGTTTDENGRFSLSRLTAGKHELVVSVLGFEKLATVITVPMEQPLNIRLREKSTALDQVTVKAFDKDGWETWGSLFIESFIGTTANAGRTDLKNPKDLRFRHNKQDNTLEVFAVAPLKIQNKSLGYDMEYHLELFRIDFNSHTNLYAGYPFFKENKKISKRNIKNREETYDASLLKFMRSLYYNTVQADGYSIRKMVELPNLEKQRIKALRDKYTIKEQDASGRLISVSGPAYPQEIYTADSLSYFRKILGQPDSKFSLYKDTIPTRQLVLTDVAGTKKLYFRDFLYVVNTLHKEDSRYISYKNEKRVPAPQTSFLRMLDDISIEIEPNGNYFPPLNLFSGDYWGWSNKIADLLPLDYKPRSSTP